MSRVFPLMVAVLALTPAAGAHGTRPDAAQQAQRKMDLQFVAPMPAQAQPGSSGARMECVFPDANGTCKGAVTFKLIEPEQATPALTAPPAKSQPQSSSKL